MFIIISKPHIGFQKAFTVSLLSPFGRGYNLTFEHFFTTLLPMMIARMFCGNWISASWEEDVFAFYVPLEKDVLGQLDKHKFYILKNASCQNWLSIALCFWRRWCAKITRYKQRTIRNTHISFDSVRLFLLFVENIIISDL